MIDVLRALWRGEEVEHHGEHYDFGPLTMRPPPPRPIPILIGGHSDIALRRAARVGDGWMGVYYEMDVLAGHLASLDRHRREAGRADEPFEVSASVLALPTPDVCARLEEMGVTTLLTSAWLMEGLSNASLDENASALRRFGDRYIAPLRSG
jgi:alkanesulfonate monooxygenase SsuD/methylene tetrahydromethanopterin reductase-like flavin-dependent oxidoreductase (luciferase family)